MLSLCIWLLSSRDPDTCLSAVKLLAKQGDAGRRELEKFIAAEENNKALFLAVREAKRLLGIR